MATPTRVNPGDLITANLMNDILTRLKIVEDKLAQPGTTPGVVRIAAMSPAGTVAEPIRVNQTLQIVGENFGFFAGQASVTFERSLGNAVVQSNQMLGGSSDTRLLLVVPTLAGLSQAGETVSVRVRNATTDDLRSVFIKPVVISLQGDIFVDWRIDSPPNPSPNPFAVGQTPTFKYRLRTATNLAAQFTLSATITNATVTLPPGFVDSIEFLDESGNPIAGKQVQMGTNDSRNIIVRLPTIPSVLSTQSFRLNISASSGSLSNGDARTFTVGAAVTPPDPAIHIEQTGTTIFNAVGNQVVDPAEGRLEGGTAIKLKPGNQLWVLFNITSLTTPGVYDLTYTHKTGSGWSPDIIPPVSFDVATAAQMSAPHFVQILVTATAASVNGSVVFMVQRRGATSNFTKEFSVEKL